MFGFNNIGLLAGLAAVLVPIAIHFLTRPKPKPVYFAPYRFLVEAAGGRQAMHRLRTVIVLTLRSLAVLMLILLFSKPFYSEKEMETLSGSLRRSVIVVDASFSMQAVQGGVTLFDTAKAEAAEMLRGYDAETAAGVIFIKGDPEPVLPALSGNLPVLHRRILDTAPSSAFGDPSAAIGLAEQMLNGSGTIFIISDFQASAWKGISLAPGPGVSVVLKPAGEKPVGNIAVTAVQVSPSTPVTGEPAEITATMLNTAAIPRREVITLSFPGTRMTRIVTLEPLGSTQVGFSVSLEEAGEFEGKILIGGTDPLRADNERFFRLTVASRSRALIIGDDEPDDPKSALFYTRTAVNPNGDTNTGILARVRHSQDTDRRSIHEADAFIICPPAVLSEEIAGAVASRVANGATLICILDGRSAPGILEAFSSASRERLTPPFRLLAQTADARSGHEPPIDIMYDAVPLTLFREQSGGSLSMLRHFRHYRTVDVPDRKSEILMRHPDGSAALAVTPIERGSAVYFNFPAEPGGGNLVGSPVFPALLHECIRMGGRNGDEGGCPGKTWDVLVEESEGTDESADSLRVVGPDGWTRPFTSVSLGKYRKLTITGADTPGIYPVRRNGKEIDFGIVNIDPRESDTRRISLKALSATKKDSSSVELIPAEASGRMKIRTRRHLWPLAWALTALFFGLEMLVLAVWRGGR